MPSKAVEPPKQKNPKEKEQSGALGLLRVLAGPAGPSIALGGFGIMHSEFWIGAGIVYVGLVVSLFWISLEPEILRRPAAIQITLLGFIFIVLSEFTTRYVVVEAPLSVMAYSESTGEHLPDAVIAGIKWDSKLADVRVALSNATENDYQHLNIVMSPNALTYEAAILSGQKDCELSPEPGRVIGGTISKKSGKETISTTNVFGHFAIHDSLGNDFTILAHFDGYRLLCDKLPAHVTVQVIFACDTIDESIGANVQLPPISPGGIGASIAEFSGVKSLMDALGPRPHPSTVKLSGNYKRDAHPYAIETTTKIYGP